MVPGIAVEITVKGRVGSSAVAAVRTLDVQVVPRHDVLIVELEGLVATLELMQRRGIEVTRITRHEAPRA